MLRIFDAIERRDEGRFLENVDAACEMHWPASLPYGGSATLSSSHQPTWKDTWDRLQPTAAERAMDPRIVAATDDKVVVLWRQRGLGPTDERFDQEVLACTGFARVSYSALRCFTSTPARLQGS